MPCTLAPASWRDLFRPSTSLVPPESQDVDAGDERGHDPGIMKASRYFGVQAAQASLYPARMVREGARRPAPPRGAERWAHSDLGRIAPVGEARPRFLRVVTLEDGETVHNAFFDRDFREGEP